MSYSVNKYKVNLSKAFDLFKVFKLNYFYKKIRHLNQYIRVVNYHGTPLKDRDNFEIQIKYLSQLFEFVSEEDLEDFLQKGISRIWKKLFTHSKTYQFHPQSSTIFNIFGAKIKIFSAFSEVNYELLIFIVFFPFGV